MPLTKTDRCDACSAQAFILVHKTVALMGGAHVSIKELLFCGHHYAQHAEALSDEGWGVKHNNLHLLNVKPSVSANAV